MWLYALLSVLLLFTAAIVSNIEAIQQTLNVTLANAYLHVFVPVEALIWIRSIAIVLLIVAHAMRHIHFAKAAEPQVQPADLALTPELINELRMFLAQTTVSEEQRETPRLAETASVTQPSGEEAEEQRTPPEPLFLNLTDQQTHKLIAAHLQGIPRREICSYLKWGNAKYTTIVKPVLDSYEQQQHHAGTP